MVTRFNHIVCQGLLLSSTCRGICVRYRAHAMENGRRYSSGQKRCSYCGIFLECQDFRCPCCKRKLRTRARYKGS